VYSSAHPSQRPFCDTYPTHLNDGICRGRGVQQYTHECGINCRMGYGCRKLEFCWQGKSQGNKSFNGRTRTKNMFKFAPRYFPTDTRKVTCAGPGSQRFSTPARRAKGAFCSPWFIARILRPSLDRSPQLIPAMSPCQHSKNKLLTALRDTFTLDLAFKEEVAPPNSPRSSSPLLD
jgi:hypothetical protein